MNLLFTPVIQIIDITFARDAFLLISPLAKVDKLATLAAKRSVRALFSPDNGFAAGRAVYLGDFRVHLYS
jgi:hypothetical protein